MKGENKRKEVEGMEIKKRKSKVEVGRNKRRGVN